MHKPSMEVTLNNPYSNPAIIEIIPAQTNPLYRTYLQYHWIRLNPGEERRIQIMFEYAGEDFLKAGGDHGVFEESRHLSNHVSFRSLIRELDPAGNPEAASVVLGGAEVRVSEGLATEFDRFEIRDMGLEGVRVSGRIVIKDSRKPAPDSTIILSFTQDGQAFNETAALSKGIFSATVTQRAWAEVQGYYLAPPGFGDAYSKKLRRSS